MELSERKKRILKSVIELYIASGEPVGSKNVSQRLNEEISSATVRNEMAQLEDLGLLMQPHTSAGRIPSVEGYRYFLKNLMVTDSLKPEEKNKIDKIVKELTNDMSVLPKRFAAAASDLTGCTSVNITPLNSSPISHFEVVAAAKNITALLAVNAAGSVKTKIIMTLSEISAESAAVFTRILNTHLSLSTPTAITPALYRKVENEVKKYCPEMMFVMPAVKEAVKELQGYEVNVGGETKIFSYPEFSDVTKAKAFLNLLNEEEKITRLALDLPEGINIDIVTNSALLPPEGMSVISTAYKVGDLTSVLCVFGPKRMNYSDIKPKLSYFTNQINDIIRKSMFEEPDGNKKFEIQ